MRELLSPASRHVGRIVVWTVLAAIVMDVCVAILFPRPDHYREDLASLRRYFDYGRSVEGKLRTLAGPNEEKADWIMSSGWLEHECHREGRPARPGTTRVSIYGNSFSLMLADQLTARYPQFEATTYFGPAAPLSHSLACFEIARGQASGTDSIHVIGVLASSLRRLHTLTGVTTSFERPHPFSYPRYFLDKTGSMQSVWPSVRSASDLRHALEDPSKWDRFMDELAHRDDFYSRWVVREDLLDASPLARLFRRGWGQSVMRSRTQDLYTSDGELDPEYIGTIGPALVGRFADEVLSKGQLPVVVLFEDRGYAGVMARTFRQIKERKDIVTIDASELVATSDSRNFVADGHYTHAAMDIIVDALERKLRQAAVEKGAQ